MIYARTHYGTESKRTDRDLFPQHYEHEYLPKSHLGVSCINEQTTSIKGRVITTASQNNNYSYGDLKLTYPYVISSLNADIQHSVLKINLATKQ